MFIFLHEEKNKIEREGAAITNTGKAQLIKQTRSGELPVKGYAHKIDCENFENRELTCLFKRIGNTQF